MFWSSLGAQSLVAGERELPAATLLGVWRKRAHGGPGGPYKIITGVLRMQNVHGRIWISESREVDATATGVGRLAAPARPKCSLRRRLEDGVRHGLSTSDS